MEPVGSHGGVVQGFSAPQAEPALHLPFSPCPLRDRSVTEQVNRKRCSGLPAPHPSSAACWLLQAKGLPEMWKQFNSQRRGGPSLPWLHAQGTSIPALDWDEGDGQVHGAASAPGALGGLCAVSPSAW